MAAMKGRETRPTKGPDHERLSPLVSAHAVYGEPGRHQLYDNVLRPSGLRVTQFSATRPGRSPLRPRRLHPIAVCGRSTIRAPSASPPRMVRADSAAVALCRKQTRPFFPLTKPASAARTSSARSLKLGCGPARWRSGFSCNWPREATRRTTPPPCGVVELGRLEVMGMSATSAASERRLIFDLTNRTDGIDLSADPILLARSAVYAMSYDRRSIGE